MVEGGKAPRRQVGQQGRLAQQVLIIAIAGPQGCFVHMGSDDPSGNQTVLPEVIHNADELAFQVQVGILQKKPRQRVALESWAGHSEQASGHGRTEELLSG